MEVCWLIIDIQDTLLLDTLKQQKCSHSAGYVSTAAKYYLLKGPTQHCRGVWNTGPCPLLFSACLCVHLTETGSKPTAMVHLLRGQRRAMATKKALPVSQVKFFWPCNYHWCVESNPHFTMSSWGLKEFTYLTSLSVSDEKLWLEPESSDFNPVMLCYQIIFQICLAPGNFAWILVLIKIVFLEKLTSK